MEIAAPFSRIFLSFHLHFSFGDDGSISHGLAMMFIIVMVA